MNNGGLLTLRLSDEKLHLKLLLWVQKEEGYGKGLLTFS